MVILNSDQLAEYEKQKSFGEHWMPIITEIRKKNKRLHEDIEAGRAKLFTKPLRIPPDGKQLLQDLVKNAMVLRNLEPLVVRSKIMDMPESLQGELANIVWWDLLGHRDVPDRSDVLDDLIDSDARVDDQTLAHALFLFGYHGYKASERVKINSPLDEETNEEDEHDE